MFGFLYAVHLDHGCDPLFHQVSLSFWVKIFWFYLLKGYIYKKCVTLPANRHCSIIASPIFVVSWLQGVGGVEWCFLFLAGQRCLLKECLWFVSSAPWKLRDCRLEEKMITQRPDVEWFEASVNLASMASSGASLCGLQSIKDNSRSIVLLLWPPRWAWHMNVSVKVCAHTTPENPSIVPSNCEWREWLTCFHRAWGLSLEGTCWDKHSRDNSMGRDKSRVIVKMPSTRNILTEPCTNNGHKLPNVVHAHSNNLNGDCKMKHYVSQEKGKCKLILLLFRCKCLSRLAVFKVCDIAIICFIITHEHGECLELSGWLRWPEEIP